MIDSGVELSIYKTIFSNSREAIISTINSGLPFDAVLNTWSPSLILNPIAQLKTNSLDKDLSEEVASLLDDMLPLTNELYEECIKKGYTHHFASLVARQGYKIFSVIKHVLVLENDDLVKPKLIIDIETKDKAANLRYENVYAELLKGRNTKRISVKSTKQSVITQPRRMEIIATTNWEVLEYNLWTRLWKYLPLKPSKGTILVGRYSSLLAETVSSLARSGFAIKKLNNPNIDRKL